MLKLEITLLELLATLAAGLFTGAAIYINLVEHPARMQCGTAGALAQWVPSYKRASILQASLALVGLLSALGAWYLGAGGVWLTGGVLLGVVILFTLVVIFPTNRQLMRPDAAQTAARAEVLLKRWGRLHAVRSFLGFLSFVLFLLSLK